MRRSSLAGRLLGLALFLWIGACLAAPPSLQKRHLEDFDVLWRAIDAEYAYFEGSRAAWKRAREAWRPKAGAARTPEELVQALEGALAFLRDDHVSLSGRSAGSPRRVPAETDLWAHWRGKEAVVTAVRASGEADIAGVHPGHVVTHVDGLPIERAARALLGNPSASPAAMDWALRHVLAGPRAGHLRLAVRAANGTQTLDIERLAPAPANGPPLVARRMGDERDVGYIRIKNVLGDSRFPAHLDGALNYLKDTRALILDLRETSASGARPVTEAILARFVDKETPWQVREPPGKPRVVDTVRPRSDVPPYRARLVVLVDRWTAGEGEALAAGLDAIGRATLVGTPMAGLRGELREVLLPHSNLVARFPAQRTIHVNGTPREALRPAVEVDLAAPSGGPGDPILYQALKLLEAAGAPRR